MPFADVTGFARRHATFALLSATCLATLAALTITPFGSSATAAKSTPIGAVTYVSGSGVRVSGKLVSAGGDSDQRTKVALRKLYAGDTISASEHGFVHFTVRVGAKVLYCRTNPDDGMVAVRPTANEYAVFRAGTSFCATPARGGPKYMGVGAKITLQTIDPVFEVIVRKQRQLIRVRQGFLVVSGEAGQRSAVVVGRNHETAVATGGNPTSPTKTKRLTASERSVLNALQRAIPPVTDRVAPTPVVTGPPDPSSLRAATFSFAAKEAAVVFSCAFDGEDFRLCANPQTFDRLRPGRHTFTVKATDPAGNTGTTRYAWTVDDSTIAFTSKRSGDGQIYVMDPEADGAATRLTTAGGPNWDPEWSPDRKRIVFHSDRDGSSEIYVMNANGSDQRRLTNNSWTDRNPTWSPDGRQITFERNQGNSDIVPDEC